MWITSTQRVECGGASIEKHRFCWNGRNLAKKRYIVKDGSTNNSNLCFPSFCLKHITFIADTVYLLCFRQIFLYSWALFLHDLISQNLLFISQNCNTSHDLHKFMWI